jgi:hypothetical protein
MIDEKPMRLPDFIFGRNEDREAADGSYLAGVLVTDFAKSGDQLTKAEWRELEGFVDQLVIAVDCEPNLQQVGYWRDGLLSADHSIPPFSEEMIRERMVGHLVLTFTIDRAGMIYFEGGGCAATRNEVDASIRRGMH